jgi:predicted RNA-binding protein (virulence factor B family)
LKNIIQNEVITVQENEEVDLLIVQKTDLGYSVIVNNQHYGLIFESDVFTRLTVGDQVKGYVKRIREDNKLDITLQPIGFENFNDQNSALVLSKLQESNGFLPVTDKSTPEEIYECFGISKKAYKKAIGTLYKQRKIVLLSDGVKMT